ncbi:Arthropod neurohormone/Alpha-latrotoxin associated low molecular weight protein [Trinorchestia longiramus]|nr:Arthropod neurohormone/Alpha-latrotoxin associated low molecular weight protein [Trinorchestia longiramus]
MVLFIFCLQRPLLQNLRPKMSSAALATAVVMVVVVMSCGDSSASPEMLDKSLQRSSRLMTPPSSGRYPFSRLLANRGALLSSDLGRPKRALFDDSCKGVYDRELFSKLDRVCEDCYNLYRKPSVSYECRRDCYSNTMFESCLYDLMLHEMVDKYAEMVQIVGKK